MAASVFKTAFSAHPSCWSVVFGCAGHGSGVNGSLMTGGPDAAEARDAESAAPARTKARITREEGSSSVRECNRSFGAAVLHRVAERARDREQTLQVEVDPGPGLLRHLVLDRQVEVVGPVVEGAKGLFVLREHRGADVLDVVQEDP